MKTKIFTLISSLFVILITISCLKADEIQPPPNDYEIDSVIIPTEIVLLTDYSWKVSKYYARLSDYSLYDMSDPFLLGTCDTSVFTFDADKSFILRSLCENDPFVEYWQYDSNQQEIGIFYDEEFTDYDYSYRLEEITNDSLRLFLVPINNPDELVSGTIIHLYSVPKEKN